MRPSPWSAGEARPASPARPCSSSARRGLAVKLLVPTLVYPVAEDVYREFFDSVRAGLVLELSYQGQLYRILRMFVDVPRGVRAFARSGANPFSPRAREARARSTSARGDCGHPS